MLLPFFGLLLCAYALWSWLVYIKGNKGLKQPPFVPWNLPFIGHLHLIIGNGCRLWNAVDWFAIQVLQVGGVARGVFGLKIYYLIADPEDALTASNACIQKHYAYDYAKPWLGDGLTTASGETWKRHRKLLTPAFCQPVIYSFLGIFNKQSRELVKRLKCEVSMGRFDQLKYLRSYALENLFMTAFGIDCLMDKKVTERYMSAVNQLLAMITERFRHPWLHSDFVYRLSGKKQKFNDCVTVISSMSDEVIQKKKAAVNNSRGSQIQRSSGLKPYKAFLDLLLELSGDDALTDKEIREEVDTAILVGYDTSSMLITTILTLIGSHPEEQEKMYKEIKEVITTDRDVQTEDLSKLVYMEAVIKESARLIPIAPVTMRYVDKNVKLKNCTMRAGTNCIIFLNGVNRHSLWGHDGDQFRPERWLESKPGCFASFSLGKRNCLGRYYAMVSMKTTLVQLLRNYKIHSNQADLKLRLDFIIKPESGHEITIEERL